MTTFDTTVTVGQLVAERPSRSRVFEKLGIDFCCGGKIPLEQACRDNQLDTHHVVALLDEADAAPDLAADPAQMTLTELCDHIEQTHHAYLKAELPRLGAMTHKVAMVHGPNHPWAVELHRVLVAMSEELQSHMYKEERILFPWIRDLEANAVDPTKQCGGSGGTIANPITVMEHEHDSAGNALARMNKLSSGYTPPPGACNTFRAMLDGLAQLETDMHLHVHKENNILFPKALAMEGNCA
jgi:regulator of cell morphogenesis and NO signaling